MAEIRILIRLLQEKPDHIMDANDKMNKYWKCRMNDREDEKEHLVNKNQKLLKALETTKVPGSSYMFLVIFILSNIQLKLCSNKFII
jgi:hypothetical protein